MVVGRVGLMLMMEGRAMLRWRVDGRLILGAR